MNAARSTNARSVEPLEPTTARMLAVGSRFSAREQLRARGTLDDLASGLRLDRFTVDGSREPGCGIIGQIDGRILERHVVVPAPVADSHYLVGLHELGHAATVTDGRPPELLAAEVAAWEWALDNTGRLPVGETAYGMALTMLSTYARRGEDPECVFPLVRRFAALAPNVFAEARLLAPILDARP